MSVGSLGQVLLMVVVFYSGLPLQMIQKKKSELQKLFKKLLFFYWSIVIHNVMLV